VFGPDGSRADANDSAIDPTDLRLYRVSMKSNATGTYTVSWQVISADDGHFTKGAYVFSVGNESTGAIQIKPADFKSRIVERSGSDDHRTRAFGEARCCLARSLLSSSSGGPPGRNIS